MMPAAGYADVYIGGQTWPRYKINVTQLITTSTTGSFYAYGVETKITDNATTPELISVYGNVMVNSNSATIFTDFVTKII